MSQQENEALRRNIHELHYQKAGLWQENQFLGGEVGCLRLELDNIREEKHRLQLERDGLQRVKEGLQQDIESLRQENATLREGEDVHPPDAEDAKQVIEEQREELTKLRKEVDEFQRKNEDLLRENESEKRLSQTLSENFRQQHAEALDQFTSHLLSTSEALREERTRVATLSKECEKGSAALLSMQAERDEAALSATQTSETIWTLESQLAKQAKRFTTLVGHDSPIRRKFEEVVYAAVGT